MYILKEKNQISLDHLFLGIHS